MPGLCLENLDAKAGTPPTLALPSTLRIPSTLLMAYFDASRGRWGNVPKRKDPKRAASMHASPLPRKVAGSRASRPPKSNDVWMTGKGVRT